MKRKILLSEDGRGHEGLFENSKIRRSQASEKALRGEAEANVGEPRQKAQLAQRPLDQKEVSASQDLKEGPCVQSMRTERQETMS